MKKMNAAAVFVLLMVSATNVFADATCDKFASEIAASEVSIAQGLKNIEQLDGYAIQLQTQIIQKQIQNKEDPFILGAGQPRLQADSIQVARLQAMTKAEVRREEGKLEKAKADQAAAQCVIADKAE